MSRELEVFVFIDALGWDLVSRTGFLQDILPHRRDVEMQFGYSCSAIPTILSGTRPGENGHLSLFRYAPETSPFRSLASLRHLMKPASFWRRGRIRHWLSRLIKFLYGYTGYFQLYAVPFEKLGLMDYCEKENLFVAHGMGSIPNLHDVWAASGRKFHISDWHKSDDENLEIGIREIGQGASRLFLYTAKLDMIRHDHAKDLGAAEIRRRLDDYASAIRRIYAACELTRRPFRLTVFSDHGMTPLTKTVDLMAAVESTGLTFGRDYGACYDSTLLRVTCPDEEIRARIRKALEPFADDGHWLTEEEERQHGIWRADRAFGEMIFLVNPGIQIVPSDMGVKPLAGMHGYDPADLHSRAAILSTEPIPEYVRGVADYFKLMTEGERQ